MFLISQFENASLELEAAKESFEALDATATNTQRKEWEDMMVSANANRVRTHGTSMDVYNVQESKSMCNLVLAMSADLTNRLIS